VPVSQRWREIESLFHAALERELTERAAFLDEVCSTDPSLRQEVESLLAANESAEGFLDSPPLRWDQSVSTTLGTASQLDGTSGIRVDRLQTALAGKYLLERVLGRGGMATVYLARDLKHRRSVAIKVLDREFTACLSVQRFLREAELTARLSHPHIVPLLDSGAAEGTLYNVLVFIDGETLRARLVREKRLPINDVVRIMFEIVEALEHAHSMGILHRDVKPENILLSRGHAMLADFGIARALQSVEPRDDATLDATLTLVGMLVGTPTYMSPEQAAGERNLDARTDVYALATVAYELLTGVPPYAGTSSAAINAARYSRPVPSVRETRPEVSVEMDLAVGRGLAVNPDERWASASEFGRALLTPADAATATNAPAADTLLRAKRVSVSRPRKSLFIAIVAVSLLLALSIGPSALVSRKEEVPNNGRTPVAFHLPKRLAVLPFENLGDSSLAYFAQGVSDAVRGKLAGLPELGIMARASSMTYRGTSKRPADVARELGVRYLLTGTVRWEKQVRGGRRVQVSPELVEIMDDGTAETRWQAPFEGQSTEVFQLEGDVAARVAEELNIALSVKARAGFRTGPTRSSAAYDAYMKAEALRHGMDDPMTLRRAELLYERAVSLDSNFAQAWAALSRVRSILYVATIATPALREGARAAASRAKMLAPNLPEAQLAESDYRSQVEHDVSGALAISRRGLIAAPANVDLLSQIAREEASVDQFDSAVAHLRQAELLDPRALRPPSSLSLRLLYLRQWDEARRAANRALAIDPSSLDALERKVISYLGEGDLAGAQAAVRSASPAIPSETLLPFFAYFQDLYWMLSDAQQLQLLTFCPEVFGGVRAKWGLVLANTWALRGDSSRARKYADSARQSMETRSRKALSGRWDHLNYGIALAYIGKKQRAVSEGRKGVELVRGDSWAEPGARHGLVRIYLLVGEQEEALNELESILRRPYWLSRAWLSIDPLFASLRRNPRFIRLVASDR
jgi:eukaryotic-like serine/threonine-protein kinase